MVLFVVLAMMTTLAPGRDHVTLGTAIARAVLAERPLFRDDDSRVRTAALVVAVAFRESSLRADAVGKTNDHCAMQIHGRPDLVDDVDACITTGLAMLRDSMRACPAHPIAFYAEGPRGCSSERAQRISRDRLALAKRIAQAVQ